MSKGKSFLSEEKKDEIKWWIEDHKGKFYAICGAVVVAIVAVVMIIFSQIETPPEVIEAPEEDKYEELDIGGFDKDDHIQKEDNEENIKQEKEFGVKFEMIPHNFKNNFSYVNTYEYGFMDILIDDNSSPYKLYVDSNTFEQFVLTDDTYKLMEKNKNIFYLRCKLEDLPKETKEEWETRDKRAVLDLFRDAKTNKETSQEWNNHLLELKVGKGFTEQDTIDTIGEAKWKEIMDEMYTYFETYLLSLENEETGSTSPLKEYLKTNPYPEYDKVKIAKSPVYLCDVKSRGWDVFTLKSLTEYVDTYWSTYYSDAEEIFLNQDDEVDYSTLKAGKFYKPKKRVGFVLNCSGPSEDIVVWYRTNDGETFSKYIPKIESVWECQDSENGGYYESNMLRIDSSVDYFGYFVIGETYKRNFVGKIPFEKRDENGELVLEHKDLEVEEVIEYTREKMLGDNIIINVSDFLMENGPYNVPSGKYYIKNDTKETITLYTEGESSSSIELLPKSEIYIDWSIKSFNWRVER